jgi:hypothetical protein
MILELQCFATVNEQYILSDYCQQIHTLKGKDDPHHSRLPRYVSMLVVHFGNSE